MGQVPNLPKWSMKMQLIQSKEHSDSASHGLRADSAA